MKKTILALNILLGLVNTAHADDFSFRLRNALAFGRNGETVTVAVPGGTNLAASSLTDEHGTVVPFEAVGDEAIRFRATVPAGATAGYTLRSGTPQKPATATYVAVKVPASRADIAWENDMCAYRMYSSTLLRSEPNTAQGVDVWFKKMAPPVIDEMYQLSNYHNESQWGVDAYSVNGKRLGCGGTAVVENGHLTMHDPYSTCNITEQSALHSAFTLTYNNVRAGGQNYVKTLKVETTAGAVLNRATLRMEGSDGTLRLAIGIYQHTDMSHQPQGVAYTDEAGVVGWAETKSEGSVTSTGARFYQGAYVPAEYHPTTQVIDNHLCLVVDYTVGTDLTFYFGGGWSIFPAGLWGSDDAWFDALAQFKQCEQAPLVATSATTLPSQGDVIDIIHLVNQTWQTLHPTHGDYFWNRAVYHIGNMAAYDVTADATFKDFSTAWAEKSNWWGATGKDKSRWKYTPYGEGADFVLFGDNQVCFQMYIDLFNLDPAHDQKKIERALEVMGHEISTSNNDYLWWVDGLFMVMPIMTKLYKVTGNQTYLDKMYKYWQYANSIMYDTETGLYFRDAKYVYPAHKTNSGKKDFWARGDGWIFAAFAKVLADLPATDAHRQEYVTYYQRMAVALKQCQQAEGYWTRSLLDPAQAPGRETSGTALFAYGYAWGINNGILSEMEYGATLERAWKYLSTTALQADGTVGYIQPIGENASPNTTVKATDYHDFGVGAYLLAASEVSRYAVRGGDLPKLRLSGVTLDNKSQITVRFNLQPNASEARQEYCYLIDGTPVEAEEISVQQDNSVIITLADSLDYGRYTFSVTSLHSAEGGVLAQNQERVIMRTVPLDAPQTGITITAIGSQTGNPHGNVNDGKLSTRWSQEGNNQWIRFDLKTPKLVYAVDVAFYNGDSRVFYFKVQTSDNGITWTDATGDLVSSGSTNELERYRLPEAVTCRYVRLLCSGNSTNKWNSPTEIRIRYTSPVGIDSADDVTDRPTSDDAIYDLNGRFLGRGADALNSLPRGIYVVGGRKVTRR